MHYEIEVNVARKDSPQVWRALVDDNECECVWYTEEDARAILAEEARGNNARLMRYSNGIARQVA